MSFGPIIGGGSGGGGGGLAPVTITATTDEIDASDAANMDIPLPAGITAATILRATVTRTAGTSTSVSVELYPTDSRASGDKAILFGNAFGGVDITGTDVPFYGPWDTTGGNLSTNAMSYTNTDSDEFVRAVVVNRHFDQPGTFRVDLDILPLGGA